MEELKENRRLSPRILLIGLVILALLCLVLALLYNIITGGDETGGGTPTATLAPTGGVTVIITPEEDEQFTPTPTRVISDAPTATPTPAGELSDTPTPAPATPTPRSTSVASDFDNSPGGSPRRDDILKNGGFEEGFADQGVARQWQSFKNDNIIVSYSPETVPLFVKDGNTAQRLSLAQATLGDRYGGIYQQLTVVPNQTYSLTLNGQIRTGLADINLSSYGYRMQYAIDPTGGDNWQRIPTEDWVELPWDEQLLNSDEVTFLTYETEIKPMTSKITLFIRAWNKWADPGLAEYTLDSLSLVGAVPGSAPDQGSDGTLVDGGLPTTGSGDAGGLIGDGRFWVAMLILLLLATGAVYRGRWGTY
jgi:hypothetical protein